MLELTRVEVATMHASVGDVADVSSKGAAQQPYGVEAQGGVFDGAIPPSESDSTTAFQAVAFRSSAVADEFCGIICRAYCTASLTSLAL